MQYKFIDVPACNMCGGGGRVWGRRLNTSQGLRPKGKIGISTTVMKCRRCGLIYSNPQPVPENVADHYGVPPETYWHDDYFQISEDHFRTEKMRIRQFAPDARTFLDVGAGIGKTMKAVGLDAYGVEPSQPFYEHAIKKMGISPRRLTLRTFEETNFPQMFDVVSFGVVLEHLYDPSAAIKKAMKWLNPGGLIHIEVPNADYLLSRVFNFYFWLSRTDYVVNISPMHVPFHLYEFTEEAFVLNGQRSGYEVVHTDRYPGVVSIAPKLSKLLSPIMTVTKTGLGLTVYLRKRAD